MAQPLRVSCCPGWIRYELARMAVRYFCDNCGVETRAGELEVVMIAIPPQSETFDVCPECTRHLRGELERCGQVKRGGELGPLARRRGRALVHYRAVLAVPGVGVLARGLSYTAVFIAFFVAVTLLVSLR
jgi:hypothetical protein